MTATPGARLDWRNASAAECAAMRDAIARALTARTETCIAATLLRNGPASPTGENDVHLLSDPTRHAEMVAVTRAAQVLGATDLSGCVMIPTLRPCGLPGSGA